MSNYYIYEIKNLVNGKTYIGQRKCPEDKTPETDSYMGSGSYIKKAKDKYGIENFEKRIIISNIDSKKEIDKLEIEYIKKYREEGKAEYNIADGGTGGNTGEESNIKVGEKNKEHWKNPEYRERQRKSHLGISPSNKGTKCTYEQIENNRLWHTGRKQSEETVRKRVEKLKGRKRSDEFKKHLSEKLKGHIVTDESRKKMSESGKGRIPWNKGKKMTAEQRKNMGRKPNKKDVENEITE